MFSIKEINQASRSFGYLEEVATKEAKEILYFTTRVRDDGITEKVIDECEQELQKYYQGNEALPSKYQFRILPCIDFKEGFERDAVYCCGGPGSGKTWQIANYIQNYHKFYPENQILYVSANNIENDASLDRVLSLKRTVIDPKTKKPVEERVLKQINLLSVESAIDHQEWKDTLFIFDDIIDMKPTVNINEVIAQLTEEEKKKFMKNGCTLKEKESLENYTLRKMKRCIGYIRDSITNLLKGGRKQRISLIIVDHKLNSGPATCDFISQCSSFWLFPYANNSKESLKTWLRGKISFDKEEAATIAEIEFYQFDFLFINKAGKKFCMTPDRLIVF